MPRLAPRYLIALAALVSSWQAAAGPIQPMASAWAGASASGYPASGSPYTAERGSTSLTGGTRVFVNDGVSAQAEAFSSFGIMRNKAYANTWASGVTGEEHVAVANTETQWLDSFRLSGTADTGHFRFWVDGRTTIGSSVNLAVTNIRYAFDLYDASGTPIITEMTGQYGQSSYGFSEGSDFRDRWVDLAFALPTGYAGEQLGFRLVFMAGVAANANMPGVAEWVSAEADLSHTLRFGGMDFTLAGAPVDVQVLSDSGFNWNDAYNVPAPATVLLLITGLALPRRQARKA